MPHAQFLSPLLTSGGDARIAIVNGGTTNRYGASPYPRATLGYSSSTANDISRAAFAHLGAWLAHYPASEIQDPGTYAQALEAMRGRVRGWLGIDGAADVVFAPSGTDLEYVALALAASRGRPVRNIVLGEEEVGSGCVAAASGRFFADRTALRPVTPGDCLAGLNRTQVACLPVRDRAGQPRSSAEVAAHLRVMVQAALRDGFRPLLHGVHGSKTGLILPQIKDVRALRGEFGNAIDIAIDACQARIDPAQVQSFLAAGAIVMLTGSKFVGGPPFSGLAIVPTGCAPAGDLPDGLAGVFRRGEWPCNWAGLDHLPHSANPGLLLRLEAALFEIGRYTALDGAARDRTVAAFADATRALATQLGAGIVAPSLEGGGIERSTLATFDLTSLPGSPDFAAVTRWQRVLTARGLRLGQPVRCLRRADGGWAGTLRISLSMPLIVELAGLPDAALAARLGDDMGRIAGVLEAAQQRKAA